ncbi:MAG TPA: hypothetical protein VIN06_20040 [Devosia sp.]
MAQAGHGIGHNPRNSQHGAKGAGVDAPGERLDEFDLASDIKGKDALHGEDSSRHMNERQAQADADPNADELLESFKKTDKHYRAESEQLRPAGKS